MANCNFSEKTCDINCSKYSMCSHYYIETQLSEIQNQIATIYTALSNIIIKEKRNEENIESAIALLNNFFQKYDSEMNQNNIKESKYEEDN